MKSFLGALLLGVGILIAGVSGLCMLFVVGSTLAEGNGGSSLEYLPAVLIFAGAPLLLGIGLFVLGRKLLRQADAESREHAAAQPPATSTPEADDIS